MRNLSGFCRRPGHSRTAERSGLLSPGSPRQPPDLDRGAEEKLWLTIADEPIVATSTASANPTPDEEESFAFEEFIERHERGFVGRIDSLEAAFELIRSDARGASAPKGLCFTGESGTGRAAPTPTDCETRPCLFAHWRGMLNGIPCRVSKLSPRYPLLLNGFLIFPGISMCTNKVRLKAEKGRSRAKLQV